jgi:myosin heavy subunit
MEDLDQPALLEELQARFDRDVIYTYVGEILVSINPFKMIDVSAPKNFPSHFFFLTFFLSCFGDV